MPGTKMRGNNQKKKSWQNRNKIGKNDLISRRTAEPGSKTHWQPDIGVEVEVGTE